MHRVPVLHIDLTQLFKMSFEYFCDRIMGK